jgi:hypothetical protein
MMLVTTNEASVTRMNEASSFVNRKKKKKKKKRTMIACRREDGVAIEREEEEDEEEREQSGLAADVMEKGRPTNGKLNASNEKHLQQGEAVSTRRDCS